MKVVCSAWNEKTGETATVAISPGGYIVYLPEGKKYTKSYNQAIEILDNFFYNNIKK